MTEKNLSGQVAVVTGASRGIGYHIARELAAAGADLVLAARGKDALEHAASSLAAEASVKALAIPTDVSSPSAVGELFERTLSEFGSVDVLVNNSGIMSEGPFLRNGIDDFRRVVETNLMGVVNCCSAGGAIMVEQQGGKVVNVASNLGIAAIPNASSYCTTKAGVISLSRALALEWARHNVQVNAVAPGYIETEMNEAVRADPKMFSSLLKRIPSGRFGLPTEIGRLVRYLVDPELGFITGEVVVIDGGQLSRA